MIYVIDHNDSFTHNVVHQFALFDKVECDNYDKVSENKIRQASTIIFSPGPGNPKNYPITSKIYKKYKGKKKIIGICLGFQHILFCEGAQIIEQKNQTKYFEGVSSSFELREAQLQLYSAQNNYIKAIQNVIQKKLSLETLLNTPQQ